MTARGARQGGFTLLEVMIALAILFAALVVLVRGTAGNIYTADRGFMLSVATDLARAKMYDLEEELLAEGFSDFDEEESGDFADEGWPDIRWEAEIIRPDMPDLGAMAQAIQDGEPLPGEDDDGGGRAGEFAGAAADEAIAEMGEGGAGDGSGDGIDLGMGGGGAMAGGLASLIPPFALRMLQGVLEDSLRKIELTVTYASAYDEESIFVELYVAEPKQVTGAMGGGLGGGPVGGDEDEAAPDEGGGAGGGVDEGPGGGRERR